jgi:hypothetical protein
VAVNFCWSATARDLRVTERASQHANRTSRVSSLPRFGNVPNVFNASQDSLNDLGAICKPV